MPKEGTAVKIEEALKLEAELKLGSAEKLYRRMKSSLGQTRDWRAAKAVDQGLRRVERFRRAFSLTKSALHRRMRRTFRDYKPEELAEWEARGLIEFRVIDGKKRYATIAPFNVAYRDPRLRQRSEKMVDADKRLARFFLDQAAALDRARAMARVRARYVNPIDCIFRMKVAVKQADLPPGRTVRVWLPVPLLCPSTQDIQIVSVKPEGALRRLPDSEGEIGIAYLEVGRPRTRDLAISLNVAFRAFATDFAIDPKRIGDYDKHSDLFERFTRSERHVRLTPEIRKLAGEIVGSEKDPYFKARKLYDWIVDNIPYSGIWPWRESIFSPFGCASDEVFRRRCGDCLIQSQFYAALCRSVGVPARVCGGFIFIPGFPNDHFWAEVYMPGQGWMPVDVTMSEGAQLAEGLTPKQKRTLRDFFFGRLDPYRLHNHRSRAAQLLVPPKRSARRRAAFFTRPELECGGQDVTKCEFEWECECSEHRRQDNSGLQGPE